MYVVIAGAGEVGYHVAKALRNEGHGVALIEPNKQVLENVQDLDALLIQGNGASLDYLEQAGIKNADLFIGASGHDEANMAACAIAKTFGASTIARINNPSYLDQTVSFKYRSAGIDVAVCPELVAAQKVANLLRAPALASAEIFAHGRVAVVESKLLPDSPAAGKTLAELRPPAGVNVVAILRVEEVIIPRGDDRLQANDRLLMCVLTPQALQDAEAALGLRPGKQTGRMKRVVIAGGSRIGVRLARLLEHQVDVVIIEKQKDLATAAFEQLDNTLIITGDATDIGILKGESVETADAFVGADRVEEYNILACLIAKRLGVRHSIAFINQNPLKALAEDIGVDLALTVRQATVSSLLRWCYRMDALDVALVAGGEAQVIEVEVKRDSRLAGKTLKNIDFPKSSLVGAVVRGDTTLLPRGEDVIEAGDRLIIFGLTEAVPRLEKLLRESKK
jgi:trk/ktr system potassium uptake protein